MTDQEFQPTPQLPTFLRVICILSFIGCAFGILGGAWGLFTMEQQIQQLYDTMAVMPETPGFNFEAMVTSLERYGMVSQILGLVCSLGCLYGVLQMWKLQKQGFWIYAPCELLPSIFSLIFMDMGFSGAMFIIVAAFSLLFPLLFIIMYAANLKHMS